MSTHTATDVKRLLDYLDGVCRASSHTLRAYDTGLRQYGDFLRLRRRTARTATIDDVLAYAVSLRGKSPATARLRLAAVRRLHGFLHAMGDVDRDVATIVPSPKRDRGGRPAPALPSVLAARETIGPARERSMFGMLYGSALRISEVRFCLLRDVDLAAARVTVCGKGRAWRTVRLDDWTVEALSEYIPTRPRADQPWLYSSGRAGMTGPLSETPFRLCLRDAAEAAGSDARIFTPHGLRRARGRALRRSGVDPFAIQALYGHTSLSQTADYVRESDTALELLELDV